jgi:ssDNA-binding Zn-finger/Zn-ribbon topoisomerase 1
MIRFHCPLCDKTLKAPDEKAGAAVVCPRCNERSVVPAESSLTGPAGRPPETGALGRAAAYWHGDQALSLFSGMGRGARWAVGLAGCVGVLSLLLAVVVASVPAARTATDAATLGAMILVPSSAIVLFAVLYGHGTGCPSCGQWWVRREVEREFVDREVYDKGGVSFAKSTYRTTYECTSCRHRWSAASTDEYKEFVRQDRPRQRLG